MSDERPGSGEPEEVGADTEKFRAFVRGGEPQSAQPGNRFRVVSLLVGLAVLAVIVALLLR